MRYLVVMRHTMDDIPIQLCQTMRAAMSVARKVGVRGGRKQMGVLGLDATTPVNVSIYTFNEDGEFIEMKVVKEF